MNWRKICLALSLCLFLGSCGKKEENGVPAPENPAPPADQPIVETPEPTDSRLPDLTKAVPIRSWNTLPGLKEIFGVDYTNIVGNPLVNLAAKTDGAGGASGELLILIETKDYAEWIQVPSFVGFWDGANFDAIFADDVGVFRATGTKSGDELRGSLTTRTRKAGENQCKSKQVCQITYTWNGSQWVPQRTCQMDSSVYPDCLNYMNPSNADVKQVGSYIKPKVSEWVQ